MKVSLPQSSKEPITCSICGWSVTVELSKTDEGGQAVHESCYVLRTLLKFKMDGLTKSCPPMTATDPERSIHELAPAGIPWSAFGLIRL